MVKKSKLLSALDAHKGRDYDAEKRKKQVKSAEKRKRQKAEKTEQDVDEQEKADGGVSLREAQTEQEPAQGQDFEAFEVAGEDDDDNDDESAAALANSIIPQPDLLAEASASEAEQESDISLSDLEEEDRDDVVPHQRMTINNGPALISSTKRVAIVKPSQHQPQQPFHHHNSLISIDAPAATLIPDAMDDETRELMFYKIARDATITARALLKKEKVPFTRPADYFAEMVKTDDHMDRVKKKLVDEASSKLAAAEARKVRDAKRFGKQVQVAREQERHREKKDTLNKIQELKRKRKDTDTGRVTEGDDLFQEIGIDNDEKGDKKPRRDKDGSNTKRQKRDSKFGFGGKKRFSKSGTAESSSDLRAFSAKKMKGKGGPKRPGKSRRAAGRS